MKVRAAALTACFAIAVLGTICHCAVPKQTGTHRVIYLKVDMGRERQLQAAVDAGHQPWRLSVTDVAIEAIMRICRDKVTEDQCAIVEKGREVEIVRCNGKTVYWVTLKRLVKPGGIWTAVKLELAGEPGSS